MMDVTGQELVIPNREKVKTLLLNNWTSSLLFTFSIPQLAKFCSAAANGNYSDDNIEKMRRRLGLITYRHGKLSDPEKRFVKA